MSIHPMVKEFLDLPMEDVYKGIKVDDHTTKMPSLESMQRVDNILSSMTPAEKETAREAAHQYLFGKSPKA